VTDDKNKAVYLLWELNNAGDSFIIYASMQRNVTAIIRGDLITVIF
jgi:hypothetical protein